MKVIERAVTLGEYAATAIHDTPMDDREMFWDAFFETLTSELRKLGESIPPNRLKGTPNA